MSAGTKKTRALARANLSYWLKQLKNGSISLREDGSNVSSAIEFGLADDATLNLTLNLLARVHPLVMRSDEVKNWLPYYQIGAKRILSPSKLSSLHNLMGALYWQIGKNAAALFEFGKARDIASKYGLVRNEAGALLGASLAKWAVHDYEGALFGARAAVRCFRRTLRGDVLLSRLIAVKGVAAYAAEKYKISRRCFMEAKKSPGWGDLASQIQFQINIALVESKDDALYDSEKRLKKLANQVRQQPGANKYLGKIELFRAILSQRKGDQDVALGIVERALEAGLLSGGSDAERAWMESAMGRILWSQGKAKKAKTWLQSSSLIWEKLNDPWMVLDTLQVLDGIERI